MRHQWTKKHHPRAGYAVIYRPRRAGAQPNERFIASCWLRSWKWWICFFFFCDSFVGSMDNQNGAGSRVPGYRHNTCYYIWHLCPAGFVPRCRAIKNETNLQNSSCLGLRLARDCANDTPSLKLAIFFRITFFKYFTECFYLFAWLYPFICNTVRLQVKAINAT